MSSSLYTTLIAAAATTMAAANDPAGSWLSYAAYTDPGHGMITTLNTTWKVPANPKAMYGSNAPGWWFGIQTADGDGALIQPILAWGYQGDKWSIFNACFDWTDGSWRTSDDIYTVSPGDQITSGITYSSDGTYIMTISANGQTITTPYTLEAGQTKNESTAYFVLEHQPSNCAAYPADDGMTFDNIYMEVDNKPVTPTWSAHQEQPACSSSCKIVSDTRVDFKWDSKQQEKQPQPPLPAKWGFGGAPSFRKD